MRPIYMVTLILLAAAWIVTACTGSAGPAGPMGSAGMSYPTPTPVCTNPSSQGLTTVGTYNFSPIAGNLFASAITLATPETATAISLMPYSGAVTGQVRFGIYNDNGSTYPGGLVYQTTPQFLVANIWNQASLPAVFLPAGTYWLAFEVSTPGNTFLGNISGGNYYAVTNGWGVFPDVYPAGAGGPFVPKFDFYLSTCP